MFFNNDTCDVYIGTGAGKKLMEDIGNARKSVKIVSPFLSPGLIGKLIELHFKGVEVQLITADSIEDFYNGQERNAHKLIDQEVHLDHHARRTRNRWKVSAKIFKGLGIGSGIAFLFLNFWLKDIRLLWLIPLVFLFYLIGRQYEIKAAKKRVFSYSYRQLFLFKVVLSNDGNGFGNTYLHSKIYIIDDQIAYLGSLNFTHSGTKHNYETRVRINEMSSVHKIAEEFDYLMYEARLSEVSVQEWGKQQYFEPIN